MLQERDAEGVRDVQYELRTILYHKNHSHFVAHGAFATENRDRPYVVYHDANDATLSQPAPLTGDRVLKTPNKCESVRVWYRRV